MSSECVFCDESVAVHEHHVVPQRLDTGDTSTVSLCPTCHEKTHAYIVDPLLDALGVESADTDEADDDAGPDGETEAERRRRHRQAVRQLKTIEPEYDEGIPKEVALTRVDAGTIEELRRSGEVYEPRRDRLRTI